MPTIKVSDERILTNFADKLITDKGISGLSSDQRRFLRQEIVAQLQDKIETEMLNSLSDKELRALSELLEREASDAEVEKFFKTVNKDFGKASMRALGKYRAEYLASKDDMEMIQAARARYQNFLETTPFDQSSSDDEMPVYGMAANTNMAGEIN